MLRSRNQKEGPPVFSHEFVIQNHADIISCLCMVVFMGLIPQVDMYVHCIYVRMPYIHRILYVHCMYTVCVRKHCVLLVTFPLSCKTSSYSKTASGARGRS